MYELRKGRGHIGTGRKPPKPKFHKPADRPEAQEPSEYDGQKYFP